MPTCVRVSGGNHVETEIVHKCTPQTSDQFKNQTNDRQISTIPGGQKRALTILCSMVHPDLPSSAVLGGQDSVVLLLLLLRDCSLAVFVSVLVALAASAARFILATISLQAGRSQSLSSKNGAESCP